MNYAVGLDLSLSSTGFSIVTEEGTEFETIKTKPADFKNDLDRLSHITSEVMLRIPENTGMICIEDFFIPRNKQQFNSAIKLAMLGTCVRKTIYESGFSFYLPVTTQLKKYVCGNGQARKELVPRDVYKRWDLDVKDDNQADAIVLAKMAYSIKYGLPEDAPKFQQEVISAVVEDRPGYNIQE